MLSRPSTYIDKDHFFSPLRQALASAQNKAPVRQWISYISALIQKGVKQLEIKDSRILEALGTYNLDQPMTKEEVLRVFDREKVAIREVTLPQVRWQEYAMKGFDSYRETLYILHSPQDVLNTRLDEIRFEIEELNFDLDALATDPERVIRLDDERRRLIKQKDISRGFEHHHFSTVPDPEHPNQTVKNLLGHARSSLRNGLYFVDEIQSDWAQRGRQSNFQDERFPEAPFVTNTELWSGLILRRQLQLAAMNPNCKQFGWIIPEMHNGGLTRANPGLNDFYLKILPKTIEKVLKGTGEKVKFIEAALNKNAPTEKSSFPGFDITDKVREKALQSMPLYSLDTETQGIKYAHDENSGVINHELQSEYDLLNGTNEEFRRAFLGAKEMFGGVFEIRLVKLILDEVTKLPASGSFHGNILNVSIYGRDLPATLDHEIWHLAEAALLEPQDITHIHNAFLPGQPLNKRVREILVAEGANPNSVAQCDCPEEAAAYGFALWRKGKLDLSGKRKEVLGDSLIDKTIGKLFVRVEKAVVSMGTWLRRLVISETKSELEKKVVDHTFKSLANALERSEIKARMQDLQQHEALDPEGHLDEELVPKAVQRMRA